MVKLFIATLMILANVSDINDILKLFYGATMKFEELHVMRYLGPKRELQVNSGARKMGGLSIHRFAREPCMCFRHQRKF